MCWYQETFEYGGHGLFPKGDISEKDSTELRRGQILEGLRIRAFGSLPPLSQTLKYLTTSTGVYRYRLEGIAMTTRAITRTEERLTHAFSFLHSFDCHLGRFVYGDCPITIGNPIFRQDFETFLFPSTWDPEHAHRLRGDFS